MGLSNDLVSQFIKVTNDNTKKKNESTAYGTIKDYNGSKYVKLDGSDLLTPISSTVDAKDGERVTVMIKNHTAVVTGNMSSPAARTDDVKDIKVSSEEAKTMANQASAAANNALTKSEEAKNSVTEIQNGVTAIEKDLAETKTLVNSANTNANQAKQAAETAKTSAQEAAEAASNAEQSAQEAATKATEAKTASDNAVSASEAASSNANTAISIANTVKEDAAKLSTDLANAVSDLEGQIETVSNTMTANYATKTEVATVEGSLETKITESASAITTELTNNYSRKSDLTEAEGRLNTKIETQAGQITTIVNDVSRIDTTSQEAVDAANLAKENAEAAVNSANTAISNAQSAQTAANNAKNEAEAANTAATNAATAIANAQSELDAAKTDLATAKQNLTDLTSRVDATEDDIEAAQKAVEDAQSAVEAAQTKAEEAKTAALNAQSDADTAASIAAAAQETANIAKANAEKANTDLATAKSDLESAKSDLANLQTQADATDEELEAAKTRVAEAEIAVAKAQTDATSANTAAANAKAAADNAKAAADTAKAAADQAQADADAANDAVSDLGVRVTTAETKILQNTNAIALCASKDVVDGLGNRVSTAESTIETMADEISTKVDSTSDEWKSTTAMVQNATGFNWSIDETAVVATETQYALGTSTSTAPTSGWASSYTWTEGKYVWQRTRYKYANNTYSSWSTAVCISGNTGDKGNPGTSGRGISSTQIRYQAGSSGTTVPTGTWTSSIPATSASAPYLWTRTIISYTDNTTSTFYAIGSTPEGVESMIEEVSNALDVSMDVIVGTQTAATGSWTGTAKFDSLKDGQRIAYWLPYAGSGNATLNLTLSDGSTTGAVNCYYGGTTRITTHYPAGSVIHLTYRKDVSIAGSSTKYTGWWADANYDSGNTYDRTRYAQAIKCSTTAIVAANIIVGIGGLYQHLKLGKAFDVSYPILYAASAISASATGTNNYLAIPFTVTTTQNISLTAYKPVYIKGKLSGTTFTPVSTAPLTQTVPTSDDGYQYILLGQAYSTTAMYLLPEHPIFQYFNGGFKSDSQIATEAAKTATNYMNFDSTNGLVIGNKTSGSFSGYRTQIKSDKFNILDSSGTQLASYGTNTIIGKTSGNNVLIDNDSVDIRKGTDVVASYGEDVVIYKNGNEAFKISNSALVNIIERNKANTITTSHNSYDLNYKWYEEGVVFDTLKTFNANTTYIWKITYNNTQFNPLYIVFVPSETFTASVLLYNDLTVNKDERLYYQGPSVAFLDPVNTSYKSVSESLIDLSLNGNVWIENNGDVNGSYKDYPPFGIGSRNGYRLEMDYNEIMAKSNDTTPSHLFLNMEGGNVSINNNCDRAVMIQEGAIFAKNKNYNDGNWLGVVDGVNEAGNTTFGYGGYLNNIGGTNIYGNTLKLFSNDYINSNTSYVIPNGKGFFGTNTSGDIVNNLQPCNTNNNCVIGYGSYAKGEGSTNIYGKNVSICSSDVVELLHSTSGVSIGVGVGGGGTNRGIYDYYKSKWMIYGNETDLFLGVPGYTVYRPYYRKGDSSTICWRGAGYVTNSGKDIYFTIPLSYPIIGNPTITISSASSGGLVLRENNYYTHGSSSGYISPSSYTAVKDIDDGAIRVMARMSATTNVTNNSPIGIDAYIKITFS